MEHEKDNLESESAAAFEAESSPEGNASGENAGSAGEGESQSQAAAEPPSETAPAGEEERAPSPGEVGTPRDQEEAGESFMQKRKKRESRKELLEHLSRKNEMLMELDKQVKKATQELALKEDRYLRLAAEFENYRKRTRREWELLQKRANADLIREIVGGIDDFDRALDSIGDAHEGLRDGIKLIHAGLMDILKKAGVREIEARGAKFDPRYHEAFGEIESEGIEEGHVAEIIRKGYMLNDEVLRPARVIVSKKKS